jgi:hypothetical protein
MVQLLLCLILLQLSRAVRLHKTHNSEKNSVGWCERHLFQLGKSHVVRILFTL